MFKNAVMAIVGLAIVGFALSCGPNEDNIASPEYARVRFFHAVGDALGVNVYVDDARLNLLNTITKDSLRYRTGYPTDSTYMSVATGSKTIKVTPHNGSATLATATATLSDKKNYSVFFTDSVAKPTAILVEDVLPAVKQAALIRVANMSPATPTVDLLVKGATSNIVSGVAYKAVSNFIEVPVTGVSQSLALDVKYGTATLSIASTAYVAGRCYTIIISGKTVAGVGQTTIQHGR